MTPATRSPVSGWCTFELSGGLYGVEVERMHEVLRPQPLTRVPLAPPAVAGLLNLRGQIVPAVDLRVPLGLAREADPPASAPRHGALVVVRGGESGESAAGLVALLVDEIGDVQRTAVRAAPGAPRGDGARVHDAAPVVGSLATGTVALADRLLVVLDLDRLLERAFERSGREPIARSAGRAPEPPAGAAPRSPGDRS